MGKFFTNHQAKTARRFLARNRWNIARAKRFGWPARLFKGFKRANYILMHS